MGGIDPTLDLFGISEGAKGTESMEDLTGQHIPATNGSTAPSTGQPAEKKPTRPLVPLDPEVMKDVYRLAAMIQLDTGRKTSSSDAIGVAVRARLGK